MSPQYNRSKRSQVKADEAVELARALECKSYACCEALFPIFLVRGEAKCLQVVVHVGEIFLCVAVAQEFGDLLSVSRKSRLKVILGCTRYLTPPPYTMPGENTPPPSSGAFRPKL